MTFAVTTIGGAGTADTASAVDKLVLATVNAPHKRDITAATLEECIARAKIDEWSVHVATFFTDVSPHLILSFASAHGISRFKLAEAYTLVKAATGEANPELEANLAVAPAAQ